MKLLLQPKDEFVLFEVKDIKNDSVLVLFTSGTTSDPKGVMLSDMTVQRLGYSFVDESIDSYLLTNSFAWVSSTVSLVSSIFKGYCLVLSEGMDSTSHLKLIQKYKISGWTVYGGNLHLYAKDPSLPSLDLSSLAVVNVGGAVSKKKSVVAFITHVLGGKVGTQVVYGMTEVGIITTWRNKDLLDFSKADSSGYLAPGVEVKITDDDEQLVGPGNVGEIRVLSMSMMTGYWCQPELDALALDSDGFFRTGDAGYFDNDGFLNVVGRVSDLVIHGSHKVSLSEIEDILKVHPGVLDSAMFAKSNSEHETAHDLIAFVVVRPDYHVEEENISAFVTEHLGGSVTLKGVYFVEAIPRTHSGKVHREMVQRMADEIS